MCNKSIARGGKQATAFNTSNMTHSKGVPVNRRERSSTILEDVEGREEEGDCNLTPASP